MTVTYPDIPTLFELHELGTLPHHTHNLYEGVCIKEELFAIKNKKKIWYYVTMVDVNGNEYDIRQTDKYLTALSWCMDFIMRNQLIMLTNQPKRTLDSLM